MNLRLIKPWFILVPLIIFNAWGILNHLQTAYNEDSLKVNPSFKTKSSLSERVTLQKADENTFSYITHEPILIDDNTDFSRLGFSGKGTQNEPYLLESLNITSSSNNLISISDTTAYFQIQDCLLDGLYISECGIRLTNVIHGSIRDNVIVNNSAGIILEFSSDNSIQNNIVYRSIFFQEGDSGVVLIQSSNNIIDNNTISNIEFAVDNSDSNNNRFTNNKFYDVVNGMFIQGNGNRINNNSFYNSFVEGTCGISASNSVNSIISNNIVYSMGEWGILLTQVYNCTINTNLIHHINRGITAENSESNNFSFNIIYQTGTGISITGSKDDLVLNNTVYFNNDSGIIIRSSTKITIFGNAVYQNDFNGIVLFNSHSNNISRNQILDNPNEGLYLKASNNNIVTWNDFRGNGGNQANDNGTNNIFVFNYWDGWDEPDNDSDGFVDDPYLIGNENQDNYPVVGPITHVILPPIIISVQRGGVYSGAWTIQWTPAIDSFNHLAYYSLFYSSNGGKSWVQLGVNLTETKYTWDTTLVTNGANYVLKLQVTCSDGKSATSSLTTLFGIENLSPSSPSSPYDLTTILAILIIGSAIIIGFGIIYTLYLRFKPQKSFVEFIQTAQIDFLRSLYHKVVIGLENIQVGVIPEPVEFPKLDVRSPTAMTTYFPSDIRNELKSDIKGRTVLTLIEIAFQYPNEANPASLSRILDIPPSTLSSEINRLKKLQYIEAQTSEQVLRDARYRSYTITPKGASFLKILKGALEVSIVRIKEKDISYGME